LNGFQVFSADTAAGIALKVELEFDNVVESIGEKVNDMTGLQDHFVGLSVFDLGKGIQVGIGPIDGGMASTGVFLCKEGQISTLTRMGQTVTGRSASNTAMALRDPLKRFPATTPFISNRQ